MPPLASGSPILVCSRVGSRTGQGPRAGCYGEKDASENKLPTRRQTDGAAVSITLRVIRKAARRLHHSTK